MLSKTWQSEDKVVRKDVIKSGEFPAAITECAVCHVEVENIQVTNACLEDLKEKFHSEILDGTTQKSLIIGESKSEIDRRIERAIQMMSVSEKSFITTSVESEVINQPVIVKFEIVLVKLEPYKPIWEWTPAEKYMIALKYKETGVSLFKSQRYVDAFHKFSRACKILITLEPIADLELDTKLEKEINQLRLVLYNNMAGCQLNHKNYEYTIALCDKILDKESNNVKALYRRGVALGNLKDFEKAVADLKCAVSLEPHNRATKEQYLIYNAKLQEANQKFDDMVKRMFKT